MSCIYDNTNIVKIRVKYLAIWLTDQVRVRLGLTGLSFTAHSSCYRVRERPQNSENSPL